MRTTLTIDDQLHKKAKRLSVERQCTLGCIVEEALRLALECKRSPSLRQSVAPLKTYPGRGLQPGIDLSSNYSLLDRMEE